MSRWREFASAPIRKALVDHVKETITTLARDKGTMLELLKQQKVKEGVFLGPYEMAEAARLLLTKEDGRNFSKAVVETTSQVEQTADFLFSAMTLQSQRAFEELTETWGILSLSETAESRAMWSLYASSGRGFVVEFDSSNVFFKATNGRSLVWKVTYQDEKIGDFLQNPLSLFLTKHTEYSFEKEWRMIKQLKECERITNVTCEEIYVCRVQPGMIKSITFGYNYDQKRLAEDGAWIRTYFDSEIHIQCAVANRATGRIEIQRLI